MGVYVDNQLVYVANGYHSECERQRGARQPPHRCGGSGTTAGGASYTPVAITVNAQAVFG